MEKKKVIAKKISIIVMVIIVAIVLMQVLTKTKVMEQMNQGQEENKRPKALDVSSWKSNVTVYTDPESKKKVPIPEGYTVSQVEGENLIRTGLVIYEGTETVTGVETDIGKPGTAEWTASCNRNQWVWVPVEDVSRIYDKSTRKSKLYSITTTGRNPYKNSNYEPGIVTNYDNEKYFSQYNLPGMTRENLLNEIEVGLEETIKSIEKYGGFYIGRYETGDVTKSGSTNLIKPVVKRMNTNINYVTWYDAYKNLRTLGANEHVKANMIYGCLWDETLQWIRESGAKTDEEIYNSATWGNHQDSESFTYYTNTSGGTGTKTQGSYTRTPTGSTERNKANNIYNMAGNVREWTLEGYGFYRRLRGGGYYNGASDYSVGYRNFGYPNNSFNDYGVRTYFYIK